MTGCKAIKKARPSRALFLVMMLRHLFELILGPAGDGVDVAILVTHKHKIAERNGNWLGTEAKEAADIDNH
jgi:hypothetical protein